MVLRAGQVVEEYAMNTSVMYTLKMKCADTGEERLYIGTQEGIDYMLTLIHSDIRSWRYTIDYLKQNETLFEVKR